MGETWIRSLTGKTSKKTVRRQKGRMAKSKKKKLLKKKKGKGGRRGTRNRNMISSRQERGKRTSKLS